MRSLTVQVPGEAPFRFSLRRPVVRIGRLTINDLVLHDPTVSRRHAVIEHRSEGDYVLDLGGKVGTFVNEEPAEGRVRLYPGDRVQVGNCSLRYDEVSSGELVLCPGPGPTTAAAVRITDARLPTPAPQELDDRAHRKLLELLLEADDQLRPDRPLDEVLSNILDMAWTLVPFERGLLMTLNDGELVPRVVRNLEEGKGEPVAISRTLAQRVLERREAVLVRDVAKDPIHPMNLSLGNQGVRSALCVPLGNEASVSGLLYVDTRSGSPRFDRESLLLLTHFANIAAIKLELKRTWEEACKVRMMQRELAMAAGIQRRLLPGRALQTSGYDILGRSYPCEAVGGDYFEYFALPSGRIVISLADVAGHGLTAAFLMGLLHATIRAVVDEGQEPAATVVRINRLIASWLPSNRFITLFYGILDPTKGHLRYVVAAQTRPFLVRADGSKEVLEGGGLPLGIMEEATYVSHQVNLLPGDLLFCCSDGVMEAQDAAGRPFDAEKLLPTLWKAKAEGPREMLRQVVDLVDDHRGDRPQDDDVTVLLVQRKGAQGAL